MVSSSSSHHRSILCIPYHWLEKESNHDDERINMASPWTDVDGRSMAWNISSWQSFDEETDGRESGRRQFFRDWGENTIFSRLQKSSYYTQPSHARIKYGICFTVVLYMYHWTERNKQLLKSHCYWFNIFCQSSSLLHERILHFFLE